MTELLQRARTAELSEGAYDASLEALQPLSALQDLDGWMATLVVLRQAMAHLDNGGGRIGSGFALLPGHLLTCAHVADDAPDEATFADGTVVCLGAPVAWSRAEELDYALYVARGPRAVLSAPPDDDRWSPRPDEAIAICQYPGEATRVRFSLGRVERLLAAPPAFVHTASTLGGSSGSPVLRDNLELIGLHRAGDPNRAVQMREILRDIRAKYQPSHTAGGPIEIDLAPMHTRCGVSVRGDGVDATTVVPSGHGSSLAVDTATSLHVDLREGRVELRLRASIGSPFLGVRALVRLGRRLIEQVVAPPADERLGDPHFFTALALDIPLTEAS